jgi:hypothetical protein
MMRLTLLALAATLLATNAAAQHCWPSSVALLLRDAGGAVIDPERLDSIAQSPGPGDDADFSVGTKRIDLDDAGSFDGTTPAYVWQGRGDCRVDVREVVLRRGREVMRLWMDLHVNTQRRPGPSSFLLEPPRFAAGTWRLDVCALPSGSNSRYALIPPRWVRVSASGDPGMPWQAPQGCGAATAR